MKKNHSLPSETENKARSGWPIAIAAWFIMAFAGVIVFVSWAVRQNADIVRSDYYAEELQFQKRLDQISRAEALTRRAEITYDNTHERLLISIPSAPSLPATGSIQFYRPSDSRLDRSLRLGLDRSGVQEIDLVSFAGGLWKVRVTWLMNDKEYFSEQTVVIRRGTA